MGRRPGFVPVAAGLLAVTLLYSAPARAQEDGGGQRYEWEGGRAPLSAPAGCTCVGPPTGTILIAGGGDLSLGIYQSFVKLAGGRNARIVVIPTAEDGNH